MDLRRIEGELEELSTTWETLRFKRSRFDEVIVDGTNANANDDESLPLSLSNHMPSWQELLSRASVIVENASDADGSDDSDETGIDVAKESIDEIKTVQNTTTSAAAAATATTTTTTTIASKSKEEENDSAIDYEFGMCLVGGAAADQIENNDKGGEGMSVWDRYASKSLDVASTITSNQENTVTERTLVGIGDSGEKETITKLVEVEDACPEDILSSLELIHERFLALSPKIEKLRKKSKERDLVTKKPRFGEKTMERVNAVLRSYAALELGVSTALDDNASGAGLLSILRSQIQQHTEKLNLEMHARKSREQEEADQLALEAVRVAELERQRILLAEQARREEEEMLARRANEARIRRMEEEQAAEDAVRAADRELLALVPNIGPDGVRAQIGRMKMALMNDSNIDGSTIFSIALSSLRDMFTQIVRHPEEMKYRTVRRDHPKFIDDIGRHVGGREVLIAAGFRLESVDGVPCLYSKEPDVEKDMDGWSDWFDNLKKTLEVIENEMEK